MNKKYKTKISKKKHLKKANKKVVYGLSIFVIAVLGTGLLSISKADAVPVYTFNTSSIQGGGFQNVIAVDPTDYRNTFLGGDVAGIHVWNNTDGKFYARNIGLFSTNHKNVASVEYSKYKSTSGKQHMYMAAGYGTNGYILKSVDGGENWTESKKGLKIHGGNTNVSGLPDIVYPDSAYDLDANNNPKAEEHPRSTGRLFTEGQLSTDTYLFLAGFENAVYRVKNEDFVSNFATISSGLPAGDPPPAKYNGAHLRGIASNPSNINNIFVADIGSSVGSGGVYCSNNATTAGATFSKISGGPVRPEEMVFVGGVLYVAAGDQGVYKFTPGGTACTGSWTALNNNGLNPVDITGSDPKYQSIDGYTEGGNTVLYVGVAMPKFVENGSNDYYTTIYRSTDGGANWSSVVNSTSSGGTQKNNMFGGFDATGNIKLTTEGYWNYNGQKLSSSSAVASQIVVVKRGVGVTDDIVYSPGRGGGNVTADGGQNWYPNLKGIGVTINNDLVTDSNNPDRAFVTNTDWMVFGLSDGTGQPKQMKTPTGSKGYVLAIDESMPNSPLYVGIGNRDNATGGEVYELPDSDPANFTAAADWGAGTGFSTAAAGNTPIGIAVGHTNPSLPTTTNRVLLAYAIDSGCGNSATAGKGGLYRKIGTGLWTRVFSEGATVSGKIAKIAGNYTGSNSNCELNGRIRMQWAGGQTVYIYSPESGLWKSTDAGQSWSLKWEISSALTINSGSTDMKFFMAIDKTNSDVVSVGIGTAVKKINTATDVVTDYVLSVGTRDIGAISYDYSNNLYVTYGPTKPPAPADPAGIQYCAAGGITCTELSYGGTPNQKNSYQATLAAADTFAMDFSTNGTMYIATNGSGVLVGTPSASPPPNSPPTLSGSLGSNSLTANSVKLSWVAGSDIDGDSLSYRIKKNGTVLSTVTALSYNVTSLSPSTTYTFTLEAYDGAAYSNIISLNVTTTAAPPPTKSPNLDNLGTVDILDLAILLGNWGTNNSASDLDSNGKVNIIDLSLMLNAWGTSG